MNKQIEFEKAVISHSLINDDGTVRAPTHCGVSMLDDGGCSDGCCDDYKCSVCGFKQRVEWPD